MVFDDEPAIVALGEDEGEAGGRRRRCAVGGAAGEGVGAGVDGDGAEEADAGFAERHARVRLRRHVAEVIADELGGVADDLGARAPEDGVGGVLGEDAIELTAVEGVGPGLGGGGDFRFGVGGGGREEREREKK